MFACQNCLGNTGGGHGVEYRLYEANCKYQVFDDIYFIFGDRVIHNTDECGRLASNIAGRKKGSIVKDFIKKISPEVLFGIKKKKELDRCLCECENYLKRLNEMYCFDQEDVYIFHDLQMAFPFTNLFPFKRIMLVIHSQGTYYNEWSAFRGHKSELLRKYFNSIYAKTAKRCLLLAFPAKGAEKTFILSDMDVKPIVESKERVYLYNGVDCPAIDTKSIPQWISELKSQLVFSTVATLNEAKGVERIPGYLNKLKSRGFNFKWILVGNGIKAREVEDNINKFELTDNTIWLKDPIPHEQILQVMSITDFYILFHRQSVFDISTLEAMHYGAIPVLTPVGGNNEVIIKNNGILVDDFSDVTQLANIIKEDREKLRRINIEIQEEYYNSKRFLKRYADVIDRMKKEIEN